MKARKDLTKDDLINMLEDVINELELSDEAIEKYYESHTPAELVRMVLDEKHSQIKMLQQGMVQINLP